MDLSGMVIAVTGGTSGIGRSTVEVLIGAGARVALLARDAAKADRVAAETGAYPLVADVRDEGAITRAFRAVDDRFGVLNGLVANAGIAAAEGPVHQLGAAQWDDVISTDLRGTFLVVRETLARMVGQARGGASSASRPLSPTQRSRAQALPTPPLRRA